MKKHNKVEIEENYNRFVVKFYSWNWFYWKFEGEKQFLKEDYEDAKLAAQQCLRDCISVLVKEGDTTVVMPI